MPIQNHNNLVRNPFDIRQTIPVLFWVIASTLVLLIYTHHSFLRPADDVKELILYSACWVYILFSGSQLFQNRLSLLPKPIMWTLAAFLAYSLFNPLITRAPFNEAMVNLGKILILLFSAFFIAQWKRENIIRIFFYLVMLGPILVLLSHVLPGNSRIRFLPIGHVSYYADLMMLLMSWCWFFALSSQRIWKIILLLAVGIAIQIGFIDAARRASIVGLLLSGTLYFTLALIHHRGKRVRTSLIFFAIIFCFFTVLFLQGRYSFLQRYNPERTTLSQRVSDSIDETESYELSPRIVILRRSWQGIQERPLFGWGYGNFMYVYPRFSQPNDPEFAESIRLKHPHNEIVLQIFEGGLIGLVLFVTPILLFLFLLIKKRKDTATQQERITVLCGLLAIMTSTLFNTSGSNPLIRMMIMFYLALGLNLIQIHPQTDILPQTRFRSFLKFTLVTFVMFLGLLGISKAVASYFLTSAKNDVQNHKTTNKHDIAQLIAPKTFNVLYGSALIEKDMAHFDKSEALLKTTIKLFPYVPHAYQVLADIYLFEQRGEEAKQISKEGQKRLPQFFIGQIYPSK